MDETYTDKFIAQLHKSEYERKDKHDSGDTFILAIISVLGSVGVYFYKLAPDNFENALSITFWVLGSIFGVLVAIATVFIALSIWPRTAGYLSHPEIIRNHVSSLENHFVMYNNQGELDELVDREMRKLARKQYLDCAAQNRTIMQTKLRYQVGAKITACFAIVFMLALAIPAFMLEKRKAEQPSVMISNWPAALIKENK